MSTSSKWPLWSFAFEVESPFKAFFYDPITYILQAGILDSSDIPPADAINFAATLVPTIADTFGAIICILRSRYESICYFASSKLIISSEILITY